MELIIKHVGFLSFMSAPLYPPSPISFSEKCFAFNKEMLHEKLLWILIFLEEINIRSVFQKGSLVFLVHC